MVSFSSFDIFPKTAEDYRIRTYGGAAVSVIAVIIIVFLVLSEVMVYMSTTTDTTVFVDTNRGEKLRINIDITFPKLPCDYLSLDAMDISGETQLDVMTNIYKNRLSPTGAPVTAPTPVKKTDLTPKETVPTNIYNCESCYGAESEEMKCCKTCDDVREAYRIKGWAFGEAQNIAQCTNEGFLDKMEAVKNEGCRVFGYLMVQKVAGNFHVAPGKSFQSHHSHIHDLQPFDGATWDLSHRIDQLSFGDNFPGVINPLDGVRKQAKPKSSSIYQYFIKVVPTIYEYVDDSSIDTNQFSVTEYTQELGSSTDHGLPGVFFIYDLSPIKVKYEERNSSFASFLTGLCAIIGGIYTVSGLIDSFIYSSLKSIRKKMELGKAS